MTTVPPGLSPSQQPDKQDKTSQECSGRKRACKAEWRKMGGTESNHHRPVKLGQKQTEIPGWRSSDRTATPLPQSARSAGVSAGLRASREPSAGHRSLPEGLLGGRRPRDGTAADCVRATPRGCVPDARRLGYCQRLGQDRRNGCGQRQGYAGTRQPGQSNKEA